MKMTKKAQTATEYLIILAVVIVIALVVASLLGGFPGIGSSIKGNANQGYWATTDIVISGISTSGDGNVSVKLRNNMPETIVINEVKLDTVENASVGVTLKAGDSTTVTLSGSALAASGTYSYDVEINYTEQDLGATYIFEGDRAVEGSVSN